MKKPKPEIMWAIMGVWHMNDKPFFYVGTRLTRSDAIREYCNDKGRTWKSCRAMGDRCIKVKISAV